MRFEPTARERHVELGYAERATPDLTGQSSTTYADLTGLSLSGITSSPDYDPTRPVWVHVKLPFAQHTTVGKSVFAALYNVDASAVVREQQFDAQVAFGFGPVEILHRFAPGTCPAALKVQVKGDAATWALKFAQGSSPNFGAAFITAEHR